MATKHLKRLTRMDEVRISAVCDVVEERARRLANLHAAVAFTDANQMLEWVDLDAVYVLLPPFAHGAAERAALKHRVPFFVEKPVGLDVMLCREIAAEVIEQNLLTCVGYMNRYRTCVQRAREVFREDPAVLAHGGWISGTPEMDDKYGVWQWSVDKNKGGGQFADEVTHTIDLARYLIGEVEEVYAHAAPSRTFNREAPPNYSIEDAVVATLRFRSGAVAAFWCSCASNAGGGVSLSVFGTQHVAYFTGWKHSLRLVTTTPGSEGVRTQETVEDEPDIVAIEDRQFIEAVKSGDRRLICTDYPDGVKTAEVVMAVNHSLETGRPVSVEGKGSDNRWRSSCSGKPVMGHSRCIFKGSD